MPYRELSYAKREHYQSVEGLSKERPQPNIFNVYIIGSVLGQFAIHIATLIYLSNYVYSIEPYVFLIPHNLSLVKTLTTLQEE